MFADEPMHRYGAEADGYSMSAIQALEVMIARYGLADVVSALADTTVALRSTCVTTLESPIAAQDEKRGALRDFDFLTFASVRLYEAADSLNGYKPIYSGAGRHVARPRRDRRKPPDPPTPP